MATIETSACWGLVVVTWIGGALYWGRRSRGTHHGSGRALWTIGVVACAILVGRLAWREVGLPTDRARWIELLGLALLVSSTAFTIWAARYRERVPLLVPGVHLLRRSQ